MGSKSNSHVKELDVTTPATFILSCPGCGASLKFLASAASFACNYCGASVMVEQTESTVSLHLLTDAVTRIRHGTDKTAAELAIVRLTKELEKMEADGYDEYDEFETTVELDDGYAEIRKIRKKILPKVFFVFIWIMVFFAFIYMVAKESFADGIAFLIIISIIPLAFFVRNRVNQKRLLLLESEQTKLADDVYAEISRRSQKIKQVRQKLLELRRIADS
jgi:predicted RNA-binding Zn-ribbon protein involved in translation (DUF1610 family)